jgi:parallel beta-helix repeat protein
MVVLSVAVLVPVTAITARAAVLSCGATISQSTVLENDVGPCTNGGITIAADNVTLDLNGHRVSGTTNSGDGFGIFLFRRTGVVVRNGTVTDFDGGVVIEGGAGNTVEGILAANNISYETVVPRARAGDGIAILSSQNNQILRNTTVNNGPYSGIGLYSERDDAHPRQTTGTSLGNVLQFNEVYDNIQGRSPNTIVNNDNIGIRLEPGSSGNFILDNEVAGNGLDGITMFVRSSFNVIRGNEVANNGWHRQTARRGNGIGMQIGGANDNLVENNRVTNNADNGIAVRNGSVRNTIRNNIAVNNATTPVVSPNFGPAFDLLDNNPDCDANVWRDNLYNTAFPACAGDLPG